MEVFNYTVNALRGMISPSISNEQRHSFQAFLMQLKESQECSSVLCNILSTKQFEGISAQELEAIFVLALSILHDWMKQWWNKINQQQQFHIRQICSQLLSQATEMIHGSSYCNKLAAILADLVERQYPQYWPTFVVDVKQIWLQGPAFKQEIILKTMQFVLEDCTDSDFNTQLSTKRSEEILDGFRSSQDDILDISFQYFMMNMTIVSDPHTNPQQMTESKKCLVSLLKFLQVMALIVPNEALLRQNRNFLWLAIKGLAIDGIQNDSISSIEAIVDRPIAFDDLAAAVDLLYSSEKRIALPSEPDECIQFIHSYITTIARILSLNVENLFHDNAKMAGKADALFQDLLTSMKQPQRRVFIDVTSDLTKVLKHPSAEKYKQMEMVAKLLLEAYYVKALKPIFIVDEQYDEEEWFEIEFDDREDWNAFFCTINGHMLNLSVLISEKFPMVAIQFFGEKFQYIAEFEKYLITTMVNAGQQPLTKELRGQYLELKSHIWVVHHIFQSSFVNIVDELSSSREHDLPMAMRLVEMLWNWDAKGNYTYRQRLRLLSHCYPMFKLNQQPLFTFIDLLFNIMKSIRPEKIAESNNGITSDMMASSPQFLLADSKDDAAACLSLLIQKCPSVFDKEQILIPLLENVASMLKSPQTTHHSQESMRDALVILSTYLPNPQFQRQILDLALVELLNKISEILNEVFPSSDVILQAMVTPLPPTASPSTADATGDSSQRGGSSTAGTIFLDRANKLRVLLQGFLNSMNKVEKTSIGSFGLNQIFPSSPSSSSASAGSNKGNGNGKSGHSKGSNNKGNSSQTSTPDINEICNTFPFSVYWNELFQRIFPAILHLQELWSPRIHTLLSSNPSYEMVKRSIYGVAYAEGLKKCKLGGSGNDDSRSNEIKGEQVLKDQLYLLFSIFCKTFSSAGKQFILHPLLFVGGNSTSNVLYQSMQQMIMNTMFMEHNLFSCFMKYVVEPLSTTCHPSVRTMTIPLLTVLMQGIHKRLTYAWNGGPGTMAVMNAEENQLYQFVFHQCALVTSAGLCLNFNGQPQQAPFFSGDQVAMVREAVIREVTGVVVESLCMVFGIKGDLASSGGGATVASSSSGSTKDNDPVATYVETRRNFVWSLYFGNSQDNAALTEAIKPLLCLLLSVPDGTTVRQALLIVNVLLKKTESELLHLESFVALDCFKVILKNLIHMESWSQGMEWDFVEYLLEVIKIHDLGDEVDTNTGNNKGGNGNKKMESWSGPSKNNNNKNKNKGELGVCFRILLETGATNNQELEELRKQLLQSNANTKKNKTKQREVLRDFITTLMQRIHGKETLQATGSELAKKDPKVMDITISNTNKRDNNKNNKKGKNTKNYENVAGFDDLFDI